MYYKPANYKKNYWLKYFDTPIKKKNETYYKIFNIIKNIENIEVYSLLKQLNKVNEKLNLPIQFNARLKVEDIIESVNLFIKLEKRGKYR